MINSINVTFCGMDIEASVEELKAFQKVLNDLFPDNQSAPLITSELPPLPPVWDFTQMGSDDINDNNELNGEIL